jgi:hypothetical protein
VSFPGVSELSRAKAIIAQPPTRPAMSLSVEVSAPRASRELADQALLPARLLEVLGEHGGELVIGRDPWRLLELGERLHLDRVHVGQVLGELLLEAAGLHVVSFGTEGS